MMPLWLHDLFTSVGAIVTLSAVGMGLLGFVVVGAAAIQELLSRGGKR
jgi:hypothetical protein